MDRPRLDIGIASYRNPEKLAKTIETLTRFSHSDWRCFVVHNPSDDDIDTLKVIQRGYQSDNRVVPVLMPTNVGYAGAVNKLFELAEMEFVAYLDNDVEIQTPGWDTKMIALLQAHPEVGQVFPGEGHYGFHNGKYHECLWNAGYAWMLRRESAMKILIRDADRYGLVMDRSLGHHEEVDLMIRLRLAGYRIACDPSISILHHQTATNSPESEKRIHAGVVRWMNKWNRYFCGDELKYPNPEMGPWTDAPEGYDPRSLRYTDWAPCALYLERWALAQFPDLNRNPRVVQTSAGEMDAIEILKPKGCYIGRAI